MSEPKQKPHVADIQLKRICGRVDFIDSIPREFTSDERREYFICLICYLECIVTDEQQEKCVLRALQDVINSTKGEVSA